MGQPYASGQVGTNFSIAGPVKMSGSNVSMSFGIEKPKDLFAYTKVTAGEQFLGNSSTNKNFNTKLYPTFSAGIGYNRKDEGFFANIEQGYKEGVNRTTNVVSEVGKVSDAQAGIRTIRPKTPSLSQEIGAYAHLENYSSRGHNRNYDYKSAGAFVSADVLPNLKVTLCGGIQQNINSAIKPAFGTKIAYNF